MIRLSHRVAFAIAKIDPSVLTILSSVCDAPWIHRFFGGC